MSSFELSKSGLTLSFVDEGGGESTKLKSLLEILCEGMAQLVQSDLGGGDHPWEQHFEFHVELCSAEKIRQFNADYREKDKVTDVLSFPVFENLRHQSRDELPPETIVLGDILICRERAEKQAEEFEISYEEEVLHLMAHGFLHLWGHDHEISPEEERLMEDLEKKLMTFVSRQT